MIRRAMSSEISTALPVIAMKVRVCNGTILVWPIGRTIAGLSVRTLARISLVSSLPLKLSSSVEGCASTRAAVNRLSNSSGSCPLVKADGLIPLAVTQIAFCNSPLPLPAPLMAGASHR